MADEDADSHVVLREFVSRAIRSLQDWFSSLEDYQLAQFYHLSTLQAVNAIFSELLGDASLYNKQLRQEFFDMRCCSLRSQTIAQK